MHGYVVTALAIAGVAAAGTAGLRSEATPGAPEKNAHEQQVPRLETFEVRSSEGESTCAVTRGGTDSAGRAVLKVDPSCAALLPGMEKAKYWLDKADGSVEFTADGVDAIITFAVADGVAFESLEPPLPVISLDASGPSGDAQ